MNQQHFISSSIRVPQLLWALASTFLMGLVWRSASRVLGYPHIVSDVFLLVGGALLLALAGFAFVQIVRAPDPLVSAFTEKDPRGSVLLLPGLCLMMLAMGTHSFFEPLARLSFILGGVWQVGATLFYLYTQRMRFIDEEGVDALQMLPGIALLVAAMGAGQFGFVMLAWLGFAAGFFLVLPLWLLALQQLWLNRSVVRGRAFLLAPLALVYPCMAVVNAGNPGTLGYMGIFGAVAMLVFLIACGTYLFMERDVPAIWSICMGLSMLALAMILYSFKTDEIMPRLACDAIVVFASLAYLVGLHATWQGLSAQT